MVDVVLVGAYSGGDESAIVPIDAAPNGSGSHPVVYGTADFPGQHSQSNAAEEIGKAKKHKTATETKTNCKIAESTPASCYEQTDAAV